MRSAILLSLLLLLAGCELPQETRHREQREDAINWAIQRELERGPCDKQ